MFCGARIRDDLQQAYAIYDDYCGQQLWPGDTGVYEIVEQTKKALFKSSGVDVTIAKASVSVMYS